nr:tyrosine--tRNA ligase [Mycoplasmopsis opalescens]
MFLEELKKRGILKQISNEEKFLNLPNEYKAVYGGFDPTASSLHLGNYILISILKRFQLAGFRTYALIGGATGMIGDPSFNDSERVLLDQAKVDENKKKIKKQLESFGLQVLDNYEFYSNTGVLEFLRDTGKLLNVASMMSKDSVVRRIERGLSFTEFSYQLLQGNDWLKLYSDKKVSVQVGGSDQWGNITSGLDMITKIHGDKHQAVALTFQLLTDENGQKIGKSTGGGALWLDKSLASPFQMYQYLFNQSDESVEKLLYWLTFLSVEQIEKLIVEHKKDTKNHLAQSTLASEVTKDIFGEKELNNAKNITKFLFDKSFDIFSLDADQIELMSEYIKTVNIQIGKNLIDELIFTKILSSRREAREFIAQKALKLDDIIIDENTIYEPKNFNKKYSIFKKGKKQSIIIKAI